MNITLIGNKIVQDTKFLAFEKNNNVDVINITVDTNGEWTYKLDVRYPDKCCTGDAQYNIINLVKTDDIYTAVLTSDMLPFSGKYTMQIRAINGDKIQHSDTFDAWVKYSIEPGSTYNPVPSEFYQIEANVTEINNHPPYPSDDGYWMIYNVNTHEYEKSEIPVIAKPGDGLPDIDITTDGKYLSNDGTKAIWADVEVEQELFICTITGTGTVEHPYTCDRTTADIVLAKNAGKVIYAYDGTIFYPATVVNGAAVRFEVLNGANDIGYMLVANGTMARINVQLQQTSNRVTSMSESSTDAQYPSAKCVWDALQEVGGSAETWELIAEIDFDVDAANDVSVWEYKNLPNYKELSYKKVGLVGSTDTASSLSISINNSVNNFSGIQYAKKGGQSNGWGEILLLPFGWIHINSGSANLPTNTSFTGLQTMYNAITFDGDSITSVRLSGHNTYKIAGGKLSLYGRR